MTRLLTTDNLPARDRLAYWTDAVCDAYVQLDCDTPRSDRPFHGEIRIDALPGLELSRVTSAAQQVVRSPGQIARASEDYFLVSIQTRGSGVVEQDGRAAVLNPGDFALYDSTRPYRLNFDTDFQQFVLMLPGAALRARLRQAESLTARAVSGSRGAGHLMINMIRTLADDIDALEPESAVAVGQSVEHILIAGLRALPGGGQERPVSNLTALHREQVRAYVRAQLRDPQLSVAGIAGHLRVSVSTVHRAFAEEECSVSDWIRAQRLEGARADLADPRFSRRGVSEIAFAWGFSDAAHFSRAFRARYGAPPREMRADDTPVAAPRLSRH